MIVNQSGGRKKLTRCMIDDKIPGEIRQEIPLVAAKDEILWIVGGRISERYKITSQTEKVLEAFSASFMGGKTIEPPFKDFTRGHFKRGVE